MTIGIELLDSDSGFLFEVKSLTLGWPGFYFCV